MITNDQNRFPFFFFCMFFELRFLQTVTRTHFSLPFSSSRLKRFSFSFCLLISSSAHPHIKLAREMKLWYQVTQWSKRKRGRERKRRLFNGPGVTHCCQKQTKKKTTLNQGIALQAQTSVMYCFYYFYCYYYDCNYFCSCLWMMKTRPDRMTCPDSRQSQWETRVAPQTLDYSLATVVPGALSKGNVPTHPLTPPRPPSVAAHRQMSHFYFH